MPKPSPDKITGVEDLLGPQGLLARHWKDYEARPGQVLMAGAVARAFDEDDVVLIEAGTGTGKTLAYLLPALLNGKKTIISTGTKNLQEQIFDKDIPFIRRYLGQGFKAACLKGRENYLCRYRAGLFFQAPSLIHQDEAVYVDALKAWAETTETGDRATLTDLPDDFQTWADLSASADRCLGGQCPDFADCFIQKARRTAAAADVVVVNHHLFMADLVVRAGGYGEVIPNYEAVIFDEAHQIEDVATQYFGLSVSSWRLHDLRRDIAQTLDRAGRADSAMEQGLIALGHQADALAFRFLTEEGHLEMRAEDNPVVDRLHQFGSEIVNVLDMLAARLEARAEGDQEIAALAERTRTVSHDLTFILEGMDRSFVYWAERRRGTLFLKASPIEIGPVLQNNLYRQGLTLVFTSATLTADQSFDHIRERLGLLPETEALVVDSPFDYERQTLLYVPAKLPMPQSSGFQAAIVSEIESLLILTRGRAFALFTSYANLHYVASRLADRLPWPVLVQGDAPRSALLDRFRQDTTSVLFATQSFWEGVDVPGESLSAVIIDKLPFAPPDQPILKARLEKLKQDGLDPFMSYQVPEAVISLKQGLGRLIRSQNDRGLLAVLDTRLVNRGYGKIFLRSLPGSPLTRDRNRVDAFFKQDEENRE